MPKGQRIKRSLDSEPAQRLNASALWIRDKRNASPRDEGIVDLQRRSIRPQDRLGNDGSPRHCNALRLANCLCLPLAQAARRWRSWPWLTKVAAQVQR